MSSITQIKNTTKELSQREIIDQADDAPEVEAWQQLPEESGKIYHAFCLYLHAGTCRSLRNVTSALGKDKGYLKQLEKWSSTYNWNARADAWDVHVEKLIERQYIESVLAMTDRHIQQAHDIQEKAYEQLMSLDLTALKPSELIRLYDITVKVERESCKLKSEFVHNKKDAYDRLKNMAESFD
ncbi:MAG: hypothetical protein WCE81_07380 [Halobacteriota archaeon]